MSRSALTWVCFALGAIIVACAVGWVTRTAIELDDAQRGLQRDITTQQTTRLALWRMDSAAMPWLAVENVKPFTFYQRPVAEDASGNNGPQQAVRLYFQFAPDGTLSSPQVSREADAKQNDAAGDLALIGRSFAPESLVAAMPVNGYTPEVSIQRDLRGMLEEPVADNGVSLSVAGASQKQWVAYQQKSARSNERDYEQRNRQFDGNNYGNMTNNAVRVEVNQEVLTQSQMVQAASPGPPSDPQSTTEGQAAQQLFLGGVQAEGLQQAAEPAHNFLLTNRVNFEPSGWLLAEYEPMRPIVVDDMPLIVRRVTVDGKQYVQGCLLDWAWIRSQLLNEVEDLLPDARLKLIPNDSDVAHDFRLAALPVALTPGLVPLPELPASPLRTALTVAWTSLIASTVAVGLLLFGVMQLSQRRAAFVRAVTHEMRTPLTTFQLYTDLLASGRVKDADQQQQYVATLHRESDRLSHMVENVLAHARLERRHVPAALADIDAGALLDRAWDRLAIRADQANMKLVRHDFADAADVTVCAERGSVEQVLLNLVDNACKYAAKATDRQIHIELEAGPKHVIIRVADHGPGLPAAQHRRLFRAFNKSADEAAVTAPGVGLGLALSRRLARSMGGDLRQDARYKDGAAFELLLIRA